MNGEPIFVARLLLMFDHVLKKRAVAAGMIEHAVENNPHAALVRFLNQCQREPVCRRPCPG